MSNEKTVRLDNVTMHREADGTLTINPKAGGGCVNIGLLIATVIVTFGGLAASINGVFQLFNPESESNPGIIVFGLFACVMFGSYALYLYSKMPSRQRQEQITISPILNIVKIGDRVIPFGDIADISTHNQSIKSRVGDFAIRGMKMNRIGNINFMLVLLNGDMLELGRLAVDKRNFDQREAEIIAFLKVALKKNLEEDQYLRQRLGK